MSSKPQPSPGPLFAFWLGWLAGLCVSALIAHDAREHERTAAPASTCVNGPDHSGVRP